MTVYPIMSTFARGELTPKLHGRVDIQHYQQSLATATNWIVSRQGGLRRRSGFRYIHPLRDSSEVGHLVRFEFNAQQAYALCLNNGFIRFFTMGGIVTQAAQNITGITQANPAVVTYSGSDTYANGDRVLLTGIVGMTELNNREATVANVNTGANTFELSGINSTGYTAWSSGGTVKEIYEIAHPYSASELIDLQFAQSADTIFIAHPSYAPRKLVRTSELSWALSTITFEDGPYLDEATQGTVMTPAASGAVHPTMSGNTTPTGTVANDESDTDAWKVFDQDQTTHAAWSDSIGTLSYDFAGSATKVCDAYWIRADALINDTDIGKPPPRTWKFAGNDGSNWITLDFRQGEEGWGESEVRFYEFDNTGAYLSYRIDFSGADSTTGGGVWIAEMGWHESGDTQTAFNLTASAVTGINGGSGFVASDVGRSIRLKGADDKWRWARIVARTSSTVVTIRLYGHALPDLTGISHWQMSAFSATDGFPAAVGFFEDRLGWGGTTTHPRTVYLSAASDYENHRINDPLLDSDAVNVTMSGGELNKITFLAELTDMAIGTAGTMRILGPTDPGQAFANDNVRQKAQGTIGAAAIQPVVIGQTLIFVDRYKQRIYEFAYDYNAGGYTPRELSILSDHLFLAGVAEINYLQDPDNLVLHTMADGTITCLTYEQSQQIAGITPLAVAGGGTANATVESLVSIPSTGGDVLYGIIKRTINSATVRYVEYMAPSYETGDDITDAIYLDSAGVYDSTPTATVTGLNWLIGESLGILADGLDVGDATVSSHGILTLPNSLTASTIIAGKRYTSRGLTLRAPTAGNQDGSAFGRQKRIVGVSFDLLNTAGLKVGTLIDGVDSVEEIAPLDYNTQLTAPASLITGLKKLHGVSDSHLNEGQVLFKTDKAYPCTIRAMITALDGSP